MAVEFVCQPVLLGAALGLVGGPRPRGLARLAAAGALGVGLAGIVILPTLGLLPETGRGLGMESDIALAHATPPLAFLQVLVPSLFGHLANPIEHWWGGRIMPHTPYFMSIYVGPVVLALAWTGLPALRREWSAVLVGGALLGCWFALGEHGGLAPVLLPVLKVFRYPSKALLLPYLACTVLAAAGVARLTAEESWRRFRGACLGLCLLSIGLWAVVQLSPGIVGTITALRPPLLDRMRSSVAVDAGTAGVLALAAAVLSLSVERHWTTARRATAVVVVMLGLDLARAHAGMNPQTAPSFFQLRPELAAEHLEALDGGRVFSYPLDASPAFWRYERTRPQFLRLAFTFVNRQLLAPYTNVLDAVRAPDDKEITGFAPRPPELQAGDYQPTRFGELLPWMRQAGVARVLSLDELKHPEVQLRASVPIAPGLTIHVYELKHPLPIVQVTCRVVFASSAHHALQLTLQPDFDGAREVVLEREAAPSCSSGMATLQASWPAEQHYRVVADGSGLLVVRESFATGWRATLDGRRTTLLRANGKHRAVEVPPGEHEIVLTYEAPGLRAGALLSAFSAAIGAVLFARPILRT
jgi:hypothetical protein